MSWSSTINIKKRFYSEVYRKQLLGMRQNLNRFPALVVILSDFAQAFGPKDSEESKLRIESSVNSNAAL